MTASPRNLNLGEGEGEGEGEGLEQGVCLSPEAAKLFVTHGVEGSRMSICTWILTQHAWGVRIRVRVRVRDVSP